MHLNTSAMIESEVYEPTRLRLWTMPGSYFGAVWPAYYVFLSQNRDSDSLTRSNFAAALAALGGEDDDETVVVVREFHWAVGWIEWIAIHQDNARALRAADAILEQLEDYPVVDEDAWSELEDSEASDYWESMSVRQRAEYCARAGISLFAARRPYRPADDSGARDELLSGN